jgi:hypothetical protein
LIHDDFVPDSEMLKGTRDGWPVILSNLKTLLETDETLPLPGEASLEAEALEVLRDG